MATGTTADAAYRRDEIIAEAFRKVRAKTTDGSFEMASVDQAVKALNKILRREDLRAVGGNTHLWALTEASTILSANVHIYTPAVDILEIKSMMFRGIDGTDVPLDLIAGDSYGALEDKNDQGDPTKVYFRRARLLTDQRFVIDRAPTSVTAGDVVTGTDALNYTCILKHTAQSSSRPITGGDYSLYWKQTGSGGSVWVTATDYVNGELLYYSYKRPLYDFDLATDNPDMPLGWEDFLIYSLAADLSPDYGLPLTERDWLRGKAAEAKKILFPSSRSNTTEIYNKAVYF